MANRSFINWDAVLDSDPTQGFESFRLIFRNIKKGPWPTLPRRISPLELAQSQQNRTLEVTLVNLNIFHITLTGDEMMKFCSVVDEGKTAPVSLMKGDIIKVNGALFNLKGSVVMYVALCGKNKIVLIPNELIGRNEI